MLIYSSGGAGQGEGPRSSRKGFDFDLLVMLVCWSLWKERNARNFRNEAASARESSDLAGGCSLGAGRFCLLAVAHLGDVTSPVSGFCRLS
jgi:hypothetical protein